MAMRLFYILCLLVCVATRAQPNITSPFYVAGPLGGLPIPSITFTQLLTNNSTANAIEYVTSSFTTSANKLVLAAVITSDTVLPDVHVLSSLHGTWVNIGTTNFDTATVGLKRLTLWRTMSGSGGTSTLTNKFVGAATGCAFNVVEFGGVDTSGSQGSGAIVQVVMDARDASANPSITLAALDSSGGNAVFAAFGTDVNPFAGTAEASWTEQFDSGYNTPTTGIYATYRIGTTDNTVVVTRAAVDWGGIAVEIKKAP